MTTPSLSTPATAHTHRARSFAVSALTLMLVLAALDQTILSTALPSMGRDLPGAVPPAWAFSAYLLAATVVIALYGRLADVYGRKPVLLASVGLFLLGSLACATSQTLLQLVIARALQGAGGGGLMTLAMLTVAALFSLRDRGRYQALLGAVYGVATMFGPLMGGWLTEHLSWRWAFGLNVPLSVLAWAVLAATLPSRHEGTGPRGGATLRPRTPVDLAGAVLLAGALCSGLLLTQAERLHLPAWLPISLIASAAVLSTGGFVLRQRYAAHPLIPLSLFASPAYAAAAAVALMTGVALYAAVVFLPTYLQTVLRLAPTAAAWHLLPLMAGVTAAAMASGRLLRAHMPARRLGSLASLLVWAGFALLAVSMGAAPAEPLLLSACLLPLGVGMGLLFPIITMVSQRAAPASWMGIATAVPVMLRSVGGAVGVALLAMLFSREMHAMAQPLATASGAATAALQVVWGCAAGTALLGVLACRWLPAAPMAQPSVAAAPGVAHPFSDPPCPTQPSRPT